VNRNIFIVFASARYDFGFAADDSLGVFGSLDGAKKHCEALTTKYDAFRIVTVKNGKLKCLLHYWNSWEDCNC